MYKSARRSPLQSNINDKIQSLYVKQKNLMFQTVCLSIWFSSNVTDSDSDIMNFHFNKRLWCHERARIMWHCIKYFLWLEMEKTLSRIRNLRARRKLSLPASPSPGFPRPDPDSRLGSEDDLVEWSVRIRSLIPDLQTASKSDGTVVSNNNNNHHHEVKKSNSERRKVVQWDPAVCKFPGRAQSEKSARKKRSGSVSVISERAVTASVSGARRDRDTSESHAPSPAPPTPQFPAYPYPRHGSLPHAFRNGNHRHHLGELLVTPRGVSITKIGECKVGPTKLVTIIIEVFSVNYWEE